MICIEKPGAIHIGYTVLYVVETLDYVPMPGSNALEHIQHSELQLDFFVVMLEPRPFSLESYPIAISIQTLQQYPDVVGHTVDETGTATTCLRVMVCKLSDEIFHHISQSVENRTLGAGGAIPLDLENIPVECPRRNKIRF